MPACGACVSTSVLASARPVGDLPDHFSDQPVCPCEATLHLFQAYGDADGQCKVGDDFRGGLLISARLRRTRTATARNRFATGASARLRSIAMLTMLQVVITTLHVSHIDVSLTYSMGAMTITINFFLSHSIHALRNRKS